MEIKWSIGKLKRVSKIRKILEKLKQYGS